MKLTKVFGVTAALGILGMCFVSSPASALLPQCGFGVGYNAYQEGYDLQNNQLRSIWARDYQSDCPSFDSFRSAVDRQLSTFSPSPSIACRNDGINDATRQVISSIQSSCVTECRDTGVETGRYAGNVFCELPVALPAISGPGLCSFITEATCRSSMDAVVAQSCAWKRNADPFRFNQMQNNYCVTH